MSRIKRPSNIKSRIAVGQSKCPDCGATYKTGVAHVMFCPAHTCEQCGTSSSQALEVGIYRAGERLCERCGTEAA